MDTTVKETFIRLWQKYFNNAELPVVFYYTDDENCAPKVKATTEHRCIIADIARVRKGRSLSFDLESISCFGGKRYLGFSETIRPHFEYFLSYGIPGEMEGERYKKTPEIVNEVMKTMPLFKAPGRYIVFKRWDKLSANDNPEVVIFFNTPDVISGLFTLANYDETDRNSVFSPFGAGCATIVLYPYLEKNSAHPRSVLGMFDISARPCIPAGVITLAVPINKFLPMIDNMDESFLTTASWNKVYKRIKISYEK